MLSVANDCAGVTVHVSSICDIAKLLNKSESAIYGPSLEQMDEYNSVLAGWKSEIKTVNSVSTILNDIKSTFNVENIVVELDAPELLQVSAGFAIVRQAQVKELFSELSSRHFLVKSQKRQLQNTHNELINHLENISDSFLSFRHLILYSRGQASEFRASRKALLSVVKAANNTNGTGEFEEV
jgi:hypothetical protein